MIVDFPEPESPTNAFMLAGYSSIFKFLSIFLSFSEGYPNVTFSNLILPIKFSFFRPLLSLTIEGY
jgi:hypothetical protein